MEEEGARLHAFQTLLDGSEHATEPRVEMTALRKLCARGIPSHPPHLRPLAWSLLLEVLPAEKRHWRQAARTGRQRYYALVRTLMDDLEQLDIPSSKAEASDTLLTQLNKDLERSFSSSPFFRSRSSPSKSSPLAPPANARGDLSASDSEEESLGESSSAILNRRAAFRRLEMIAEAEHRRSHTPVLDRKGKGRELASPMDLEIQSTQRRLRTTELTLESVLSPRITLSASGSRASSPVTPAGQDSPLTTPQLSLSIPSVQSSPSAPSRTSKAPSPITLLSPKPLPGFKLPFHSDSPALPGSLLQPDTHAESILRILYVFVKAHPQWEYTQGFADVLIPLYMIYALGGDGEPGPQRRKKEKRLPKTHPADTLPMVEQPTTWGRHAEEETFWAFAALMGELGSVVAGPPKSRDWTKGAEIDGVKAALERLSRRVRWADEELWTALRKRNLDPATPYYSYRYVALLMSRDLPKQALMPAWDLMLSQASTTSDSSPKLDILMDLCTAMLLLLKARLLTNPRKSRNHQKSASAGFWGVTEEVEVTTSDALDENDPDALGEAFARGMRLLQEYPLSFVGGIEAILDVTFKLQQERQNINGTKEDPDSADWIEAKANQDSRASWNSAAGVLKAANLASGKLWGSSAGPRNTVAAPSPSPSLFNKYASALQNSDAAASVARTSQSWGASAMAKWNASTTPGSHGSSEAATSTWGSLGSAAGRLLGTASPNRSDVVSQDRYTPMPTSPPTPRRLHKGSSGSEQRDSFSGISGSPSYLESLASVASRPRSDSNSSIRSSVSLQDRLAGLATGLTHASPAASPQQPGLAGSSPSGPRPLLLSGSARRASNTTSTPTALSRGPGYKRISLVNQDSPIGKSPLSPPVSTDMDGENEAHRVIPIGRSRNVTPASKTPDTGHAQTGNPTSVGEGITAAALRLRHATSADQSSSPSLTRSPRQGALADRAGKPRLIGRRTLDRPRPMSSSSMDSHTAPSTPGGSSPTEDDTIRINPGEKYALTDESPSSLSITKQNEKDGLEHMQWIANGVHGSVYMLLGSSKVVKVVHLESELSVKPHDVRREVRILARISHPAVSTLYDSQEDGDPPRVRLYMPFFPVSLAGVVAQTAFVPVSSPASRTSTRDFYTATTSWIFQLLLGLAHLHACSPTIAHRDIKPSNIMLSSDGSIKLIDFATALEGDGSRANDDANVCEVGSGPYRAPELLFGPHHYDALALDLWSAGASLAEIFTPFRLCDLATSTAINIAQLQGDSAFPSAMQYDSDESDSESSSEPQRPSAPVAKKTWKRMTLFNADRGDLGLAWSIFQIRGTPTQVTWPLFDNLPDATKIQFAECAPRELDRLLPFAKPHTASLLSALLSLDPTRRLSAADALELVMKEEVVLPLSLWRDSSIFFGEGEKRITLAHERFRPDKTGFLQEVVSQLVKGTSTGAT